MKLPTTLQLAFPDATTRYFFLSHVAGVWQHLAASMDAHGNVSLYKNGVLVGKQPTNIPPVQQRTRNLIGRSNWDLDAHYKGCMDDLRIYERALTGNEIEAIAKAGMQ